jgi:hypothetical protein
MRKLVSAVLAACSVEADCIFSDMALPAVTSVTNNGGVPTGGTKVVIAGTALTGATSVKFGANSATAVVVASSTEITCTAPAASWTQQKGFASGPVDVIVTTPEGASPAVVGDVFVYWAGQAIRREDLRTYETVPLGAAKVAGTYPAGSPVSYYKFAAAETLATLLEADYAKADFIDIEISAIEVEGTVKITAGLEDSIDGGLTYNATVVASTTAALTAAATHAILRVNMKETVGSKLKLNLISTAACGIAGSVTVATSHA